MAAFENTVTITRPVEEVFTYLADAENLPQWNYAIEQTRKISPGPVGVGTLYRQTRTLPGRSQEDFEPAASGTTLTNKWDLQPTSASLRLLGPLAIPKVKSAVAENLRTLKQILENVRG
jgi:uncharacterized protein YndB with AHSA1/START domain